MVVVSGFSNGGAAAAAAVVARWTIIGGCAILVGAVTLVAVGLS